MTKAGYPEPTPIQTAAGSNRHRRALVIVPTREIVSQIEENVRDCAKHLLNTVATVFGSVGAPPYPRVSGEHGHCHRVSGPAA